MVAEVCKDVKEILNDGNVLVFDCRNDECSIEPFVPATFTTGNICDLDPSWKNIPVIDCSQWEYPDEDHDYRIYVDDIETQQDSDFKWYIDNFTALYDRYGDCWIAIKNKCVLGSYPTFADGVIETRKTEAPGTYIIQKCARTLEECIEYIN